MKKTLVTAALAAASVLALNAPAMVGAAGPGQPVNSIADFTILSGDGNGNSGTLELISVPNLHFGSPNISSFLGGHAIQLSTGDSQYYGQNETTRTPGHIAVKDYSAPDAATPKGNGWHLKASMGSFTSTENNVEIDGTLALAFVDTPDSDNAENGMEAIDQFPTNPRNTLKTDEVPTTIVDAAINTGRGTTAYDATTDLSFTPVANQDVVEGLYSSTITWSLEVGPA